ncbi:pancreatic lipase-related protein 3 [Drosophila tropicalis]|uniref:pancreatic lipase-related protein 3 n=1 Tax=Drosophila tropicalis TaxID=46794 RepID=UPI0035ABFE64
MQKRVFLIIVVVSLCSAIAAANEPKYILYTQRIRDSPQTIEPEAESLVRSSFYALDPIIVSIPRWLGNSSTVEHSTVVAAKLDQETCNVITVDLEGITNESDIIESVGNLIVLFNRQFDVSLEQLSLVGFAEGAHLAGGVGEKVKTDLGQQLTKITALDPTAENGELLQHKLSAQDAEFVEVIHTNSGGAGTWEELGHVDYYPNGGDSQPGCDITTGIANACSHERALHLLNEMWSPSNDFVSARCGSVLTLSAENCRWSSLRMGEADVSTSASGIYFLETHSSTPYSRGAYYIGFL